ncbi:MAG TPA: histidine phosphatase family protein [Acidimicrobiales bacterium]
MAGPELLVLARHARPTVDPAKPASEWDLCEEGALAARRMGERLRSVSPSVVVSSVERKAIQTGAIAADVLGVTFQTGQDLHEHVRPFLNSDEQFEAEMERFFARPSERVFGEESASAVGARFTRALDAMVAAHRGERLVVVAHGTVLSLHLAGRYGLDAARVWGRLGMPSFAVVETRTKTLVDLVEAV